MSWIIGGGIGLAVFFAESAFRERARERALRRVEPAGSGGRRSRPARRLPALTHDWRSWAVLGAIGGLSLGGFIGAALGMVAGAAIGIIRTRRSAAASAVLRDEQLADAVRSISAGLRAGLSIQQSIAYAAEEAEPPIRDPLRDLADAVDMGVPLDEALVSWADSVATDDSRLLAGVLRMHRRSGGDLPAVLDEVGTTLRDRRVAAGEVRALTAQARLSGAILGFLPIGFFAFLWLTSRRDIAGAFNSSAGVGAIGLGLGLDAVAFLWIRRLLEVR